MQAIAKILTILGIFLLSTTFAETSQDIRILILEDAASFSIKTDSPYKIKDSAGKKILSSGEGLNSTVTAYQEGILIGGQGFQAGRLIFSVKEGGEISVNGRKFAGAIEFIKNSSHRLYLVNHIGLEDYIKGILYHEASHYWPMEVLKAQAIACRSYAVYQMRLSRAKDYDLTSDVYSQVYGGRTSERYRTNVAVDKTAGLILTYNDEPLAAFFHAACGGHTEDASLVWSNIDSPALKAVVCGFCKGSPHYNWHCVLPLSEIKAKLNKSGYKIDDIKEIAISGRDGSGRVTDVEVINSGEKIRVPASKLRIILGPNIIRSAVFSLEIEGGDAVFNGLGWGHGVGLCQWGAYFMAKDGRSYKEILNYYYPGVKIETIGF